MYINDCSCFDTYETNIYDSVEHSLLWIADNRSASL